MDGEIHRDFAVPKVKLGRLLLYNNGNTFDSNTVMAKLTILSVASIGVQVRRLSDSVKRPILVKIQKPESFIQLPMSEPAPMAVAR